MTTPREIQIRAARDKMTAKMKAGVYTGDRRDRVAKRLREMDASLELLKGATNRRVETPSVGAPGATIGVGSE
jgi:hypothetical protein